MPVHEPSPTRRGRELQGYGAERPNIRWPNGSRVALSVVLNFEEGSERTPLYGDAVAEPVGEGFVVPPGLRDVRHESALEYGTRVGVWRILQTLKNYEVRATVFAAALALEHHPAAGKALADAGHEMASHGYRWLPFNTTVSEEEERRWVDRVVSVSLATTGQRPVGWFSRGPRETTREMLVDEGGFLYDCDSFADDLPYFVKSSKGKWLVLPYNTSCNDMNFWRPPGYSNPDDYFVRAKAALDRLHNEGRTHPQMMSFGLHLRGAGRPSRIRQVERFLDYARELGDVWIASRREIAEWWLANYDHLPAFES